MNCGTQPGQTGPRVACREHGGRDHVTGIDGLVVQVVAKGLIGLLRGLVGRIGGLAVADHDGEIVI